MKVILNMEDVVSLIQKSFSGVKEAKYDVDEDGFILEVDPNTFSLIPQTTGVKIRNPETVDRAPVVSRPLTPEQEKALARAEEMNGLQNDREEYTTMSHGQSSERKLARM